MDTSRSLTLPQQLLKPAGSEPGIYALLLRIEILCEQQVGRLGTFTFIPGSYLYIGSARGPGGVAARVGLHIKRATEKRLHWHIDWLRQIAHPTAVIWTNDGIPTECRWAQTLSNLGAREPAGFGASDCGCPGHLLRLLSQATLDHALSTLRIALPDGARLAIHDPTPDLTG